MELKAPERARQIGAGIELTHAQVTRRSDREATERGRSLRKAKLAHGALHLFPHSRRGIAIRDRVRVAHYVAIRIGQRRSPVSRTMRLRAVAEGS